METTINSHRYNYPNDVNYKLRTLKLLKNFSKQKICNRYHISISTLNRWIRQYDGTTESLMNKSHKPLSKHPNSHTDEEVKHITNLIKRNPNIGLNELYGKLREKYAYTRNPSSLYRFLKKHKLFEECKKKKVYVPKHYDTPINVGEKWQLDVKYVPRECNALCISSRQFYQYTVIDEASRKRFIFAYEEQCASSTVDFIMRAIFYFGYIPLAIQTDNGQEFTHLRETNRIHLFDKFCDENKIIHKLIKPRTPRHNGKVERSHRNDSKRFYSILKFFSLADLQKQMKAYLIRSNNIPSRVLNWNSPEEYERKLIEQGHFVGRRLIRKV